jgi:hypothetical protein
VYFISVENVGQTLVCPAVGQAKAYPTTPETHPIYIVQIGGDF